MLVVVTEVIDERRDAAASCKVLSLTTPVLCALGLGGRRLACAQGLAAGRVHVRDQEARLGRLAVAASVGPVHPSGVGFDAPSTRRVGIVDPEPGRRPLGCRFVLHRTSGLRLRGTGAGQAVSSMGRRSELCKRQGQRANTPCQVTHVRTCVCVCRALEAA